MKKVWLALLLAVFMFPAASFANDRDHGDRDRHRGNYRDENRHRERHYGYWNRHDRRDYHHWRPYSYFWSPGYYYDYGPYRYRHRDRWPRSRDD